MRIAIVTVLLLALRPAWADAPQRVISFNLCADQLVVALADPAQIVALSPYARDERLSAVAHDAKIYPQLDWRAESALLLKPDLVLVGPDDRSASRQMMERFGVRAVSIDYIDTLDAARGQLRDVAALLGHPERGEHWISNLDAAEGRLARAPKPPARSALLVERGGYTQGTDSLAATLLAKAGLTPPPGAPTGYGEFVPLERILTLKPDLLVLRDPPTEATDQGALTITHPALAKLYPPSRRLILASRDTFCGGPAIVKAFDALAEQMTRLARP